MHNSLHDWRQHIQTLHPTPIDYSLERIRAVAHRLQVLAFDVPIITVTGTNGKGSVVAAMEAFLLAGNYHVASFTSPYLLRFNEQIRIDSIPVSDDALVAAFAAIDQARGDISLTEFEFTTLAALLIFKKASLDVIILEVGLGGGNDAVNIIDPTVTVITSLALDHEAFLGTTISMIAQSEAKLLRAQKLGVIGVMEPPKTLIDTAEAIGCKLLRLNHDFYFTEYKDTWCFCNHRTHHDHLPLPIILCKNAALALEALLACDISLSHAAIHAGLHDINIQGRLQYIPGQPARLIDVAHNLEAISHLAEYLQKHPHQGNTIAVFSMLSDKPIKASIELMAPHIDQWFIAPIDHPRGASTAELHAAFVAAGIAPQKILAHDSLEQAYQAAMTLADACDLVLIFGSFFVARTGLATA